jgi:cobalt/nickel transport system ATP-binding protein
MHLFFPIPADLLFDGNPVTEKSLRDKVLENSSGNVWAIFSRIRKYNYFVPQFLMSLCLDHLQLNLPLETANERAEQTLSYLGIGYLRDRPVYMLSGGEKKRVAIASVLTMNPDILLVDEPLSSLDPKTQTFFIELLLELNHAGKTIIFTTHHLDLIDHLQPRVAVLSDDHTIHKTGTASEILGDEELLISVNLIHEHIHKHGNEEHSIFTHITDFINIKDFPDMKLIIQAMLKIIF